MVLALKPLLEHASLSLTEQHHAIPKAVITTSNCDVTKKCFRLGTARIPKRYFLRSALNLTAKLLFIPETFNPSEPIQADCTSGFDLVSAKLQKNPFCLTTSVPEGRSCNTHHQELHTAQHGCLTWLASSSSPYHHHHDDYDYYYYYDYQCYYYCYCSSGSGSGSGRERER